MTGIVSIEEGKCGQTIGLLRAITNESEESLADIYMGSPRRPSSDGLTESSGRGSAILRGRHGDGSLHNPEKVLGGRASRQTTYAVPNLRDLMKHVDRFMSFQNKFHPDELDKFSEQSDEELAAAFLVGYHFAKANYYDSEQRLVSARYGGWKA